MTIASPPNRSRHLNRAFFPAVLAIVAILSMILAAFLFQPSHDSDTLVGEAALIMLFGGALLVFAVHLNVSTGISQIFWPHFQFIAAESPLVPAKRRLVSFGVTLLVIEAEISGKGLQIGPLMRVSPWVQGGLFWSGVALVTVGMAGEAGWRWLRSIGARLRGRDPKLIALIGVALLAFGLRAWDLGGSLPISIDDGVNIPPVFPFLAEDSQIGLITSVGDYQVTPLYGQLQAIAVHLFGPTLGGIRAVNLPLGTLNVIALYVLLDALFDTNLALIGAVILTTFPPHLHFSRLAFLHVADATFGTFAIGFLARGMKYNRRADWALAGVSLGLTQYWFEAGRLYFPPLILIWLGILAIFNFGRLRSLKQGLGVFSIAALLIALPTYYAALEHHSLASPRLVASGLDFAYWQNLLLHSPLNAVITRIAQPFLVFVHTPETSLYYAGNHPMILEALVPIFLLGAFFLVRWWRNPVNILLLWLFSTAAAGLLLQDSTEYPRFIIGYPSIAGLLAVGIYYVWALLVNGFARAGGERQWIAWGTFVLVTMIATTQVNYYFGEHVPTLLREIRTRVDSPDLGDAAQRSVSFPPGTELILISNHLVDKTIIDVELTLLRWGKPSPAVTVRVLLPSEVTRNFLGSLPLDRDRAFFVEPNHPDAVKVIQSVFAVDQALYPVQVIIPNERGFVLYYAPLNRQTVPH